MVNGTDVEEITSKQEGLSVTLVILVNGGRGAALCGVRISNQAVEAVRSLCSKSGRAVPCLC